MSRLTATLTACPTCRAEHAVTVFDSLNADLIPVEVERLLAGTFEEVECAGCGGRFRPEHHMLYTRPSTHTWIVMHPVADQPRFATLEHGVDLLLRRHFEGAPAVLRPDLDLVRPRLVFGQHMLSEAVRCLAAELDPALLECAKLLAVRRDLARFAATGPFELCLEQVLDGGALRCGLHQLDPEGGAVPRVDTVELAADLMAEVRGAAEPLRGLYPELFQQPYVSACRCLYGAMLAPSDT